MRRLLACLAVLALALLPDPAPAVADDRVGPAADLSLGGGTLAGPEWGADSASIFMRLGAGLQYGRFAGLLHAEVTGFDTEEPRLDSDHLQGTGYGLGARIELVRGGNTRVQLQLGYTMRTLNGNAVVQRDCQAYGSCTAGFYRQTPAYDASGPYAAITVARRMDRRIWPAIGAQLGVASYQIDRPGGLLDESGAMVWLALHLEVGTGD